MNNIKINVPAYATHAIHLLEKAGYSAYAVGGCVRDSVLDIAPNDWDICTSARPSEITEIFKSYKTINTGIEHGTVTVIIDGDPLEITTFRRDGKYTDNRHPDRVEFVSALTDDLARRDFTVNAMAYSAYDGLIDLYGGLSDLNEGIIRCVGVAEKRFFEDALRIMRALRFASRYGFDIENDTAEAIRKMAHLLKNVSSERISVELCGIVSGKCGGKMLAAFGEVLAAILPFSPSERVLKAVDLAPLDLNLRLAILLCESSFNVSVTLKQLRFDKKNAEEIAVLAMYLKTNIPMSDYCICKTASELGHGRFVRLLQGKKALLQAESSDIDSVIECEIKYERLSKEGRCPSPSDLAVKGTDLIQLGYSEGKDIGRVQRHLLDMICSGKIKNDRNSLLKLAEKLKA